MAVLRTRRIPVLLVGAIIGTLAVGISAVVKSSPVRAATSTCGSAIGLYSYRVTLTNDANQSVTLHGIQAVQVVHDQEGIHSVLDSDQFSTATTAFGSNKPVDAVNFTKEFETSATGIKHEAFLSKLVGRELKSVTVTVLNGMTPVDGWEIAPAFVEFVRSTEPAAGQQALPSQKIGIAAPSLGRLGTAKIAAPAAKVNTTGWAYRDTIKYKNSKGNPATRVLLPSKLTIDQDSSDAQSLLDPDQATQYQDQAGAPPGASLTMSLPYSSSDNASDGVFAYSFDEPDNTPPTGDTVTILNNGQPSSSDPTSAASIPSVTLSYPAAGACPSTARPNWTMQTVVKTIG